MARKYTYRTRKTATPQSEQASPLQVENSAGGFSFQVDDWERLERFLVLGSDGGTYYASEKELTKDNATAIERLLKTDGVKVVNKIVEVSEQGRAPKNDPALFALALAAAADDVNTRRAALAALPKVARIGTHLFHFADYVEGFRGWGRALREAVGNWYQTKDVSNLSYQVVKYQSRDGWSHRDLLRLAHPKTADESRNDLYKWIVGKAENVANKESIVYGFELIKKATDQSEVIKLITDFNLPREAVPTQWLNSPKVWEALLPEMGIGAMVRNLGKMTSIGLIAPLSDASKFIADSLGNADALKKSRIHPLNVLTALRTYQSGHGVKGSLAWNPDQRVADALDGAFYASFGNVEPTGKRIVLALDVSGSMGSPVMGDSVLSCIEAETAMALVTANVEKDYTIMGFATDFRPINISPKMSIEKAIQEVRKHPMGGTDCALPMLWALGLDSNASGMARGHSGYTKTGRAVVKTDAFVVYTDSETWVGSVHPYEALKQYRNQTGIPAKLAVVGMATNSFTIADPNDSGSMDVVGFSTATPNVLSDFIKR